MTISLVPELLRGSSELPNLFLHRKGFATSSRYRETKRVALTDIALLFTFHPAIGGASIVSVVLSLGFESGAKARISPTPRCLILMPGRR